MREHELVLERVVEISARRDTVFRYFTDSERCAAWWGSGSTIDARPGGSVRIRYPDVGPEEIERIITDPIEIYLFVSDFLTWFRPYPI